MVGGRADAHLAPADVAPLDPYENHSVFIYIDIIYEPRQSWTVARGKDFPLDELVRHAEAWATSMNLPGPIQRRLDGLVARAIEGGESQSLSRSEVVAAMILDHDADGPALRDMVLRYRLAKTRAAILVEEVPSDTNVIWIDRPKAGRRSVR